MYVYETPSVFNLHPMTNLCDKKIARVGVGMEETSFQQLKQFSFI